MDINDDLKERGENIRICFTWRLMTDSFYSVSIGIPLFFPVSWDMLLSSQTLISSIKIDPAPGATIGGMLSTGCSGSTYSSHDTIASNSIGFKANAVRYGTAKGEWFINAVRLITLLI
jgi:hypothetical protein